MDFFYMMVNFEVLPFKLYMDGGRIQLYIKEFNITREKNLLENGLVKNDWSKRICLYLNMFTFWSGFFASKVILFFLPNVKLMDEPSNLRSIKHTRHTIKENIIQKKLSQKMLKCTTTITNHHKRLEYLQVFFLKTCCHWGK